MGVAQIFKFSALRGTRGSSGDYISHKRKITNKNQRKHTCHFLLNTLKGNKITLPVVILYYSTLSSTDRQILTPKGYEEHTCHFYREVAPLGAFSLTNTCVVLTVLHVHGAQTPYNRKPISQHTLLT